MKPTEDAAPSPSEHRRPEPAISSAVESHADELIELRRHLHQHPELSSQEFATTRLLSERLRGLGLSVHVRPEGVGLYADLVPDGFDPGHAPTVAIRCDLDALPIVEQTGLPYASTNHGVMHACGHDMHMTCASGAALALASVRNQLPGRIRFLLQHAEEIAPGGAVEMVEFGAMAGVQAMLGLHVDPALPVGTVGLKNGAFTAASDTFTIDILGRSGHGARPHHAVDPVFVGCQVAAVLYNAARVEFDARDPVVMTIGQISGGHSPNVIPDAIQFRGTVRTLSTGHRERIRPLFERILENICGLYGASYAFHLLHGPPAIVNDPACNEVVLSVAEQLLGEDAIAWIELPSMGSEDFSFYLEHAPGTMFRLGVMADPDAPLHFLHSDQFAPDERAIGIGAKLLAQSALALLERHR